MKCWATVAVFLLSVSALTASAQSAPEQGNGVQETQKRGYWTDPSTGLMWAGKDNGKDVGWKKAKKYCRDLRLAGYSDWRLADLAELQRIYDGSAIAPGLAGPPEDPSTFTWHVKANLFLTGNQWSSSRWDGYAWYVDFNAGRGDRDELWAKYRALCVRGSGK